MPRVTQAVIPAAGRATRMQPATRAVPKPMLPIVDTPVLQLLVEEALASGIERIIVVTGPGRDLIETHFAGVPAVTCVDQPEPLGLGDAVRVAGALLGRDPFAVMLGDAVIDATPPALRQVIDCFERTGRSVLALETVPCERVSRVGIVTADPPDDTGLRRIRGMVEKPDPARTASRLASACRYVFTPAILDHLAATAAGHGGEIQLTDAIDRLAAAEPVHGLEWSAKRYDIGNPTGYAECFVDFALRRGDTRAVVQALLKAPSEEQT